MNGAFEVEYSSRVQSFYGDEGRKTEGGGGLETHEIGWCRLGGRGGRADKRDTMKRCGASSCDCQLKHG